MTLYTVPNDLFTAFEHSLRILSWQELPEDESPPSWMWHLDWEIEDWFIKVKNDRKAKYGISGDDQEYLNPDAEDYDENVLFDEMKYGSLFDE